MKYIPIMAKILDFGGNFSAISAILARKFLGLKRVKVLANSDLGYNPQDIFHPAIATKWIFSHNSLKVVIYLII